VETRLENRSNTTSQLFSADYDRPLGNDQISLGTQVTREQGTTDRSGATSPNSYPAGFQNPLDSVFWDRQDVLAAYVTYQKEFGGKWTALAGLRSETVDLATDLVSSRSVGHISYTTVNPSFFATYTASSEAKWRLSYSRRLDRPSPRDLNPYFTYSDSSHVLAGNPHLKPQVTDTYEIAYDYHRQATSLTVRAFYDVNDRLITPSSFWIADPENRANAVIETTQINGGKAEARGVQATYNTRIAQKLSVSADLTLQRVNLDLRDSVSQRAGNSANGLLGLYYTLSSRDNLNYSVSYAGRRLNGQGVTYAFAADTFTYVHALSPTLMLTFSATNLLRMNKIVSLMKTSLIDSRSSFSLRAPTVSISLSRSFSGFARPAR